MKRENLIDNVVHMSSRYTNSSTQNPIGICFKKNRKVPDHPYVTTQGFIMEDPDRWYTCMDIVQGLVPNNDKFKIFSKFNPDLAGEDPKKPSTHAPLSHQESQVIEAGYTRNGDDPLDFRTKQIFLPFNGTYLAATPLESYGIIGLIKEKILGKNISTCVGITVGGANPQNVSVRANSRAMSHYPLFFSAHSMDVEIQKQYSYKFRDMYIKVDPMVSQKIITLLDNPYGINQKKRENILTSYLSQLYSPFFKQVQEMRKREYSDLTTFNGCVYNNIQKTMIATQMYKKTHKQYGQISANTESMLIRLIEGLL